MWERVIRIGNNVVSFEERRDETPEDRFRDFIKLRMVKWIRFPVGGSLLEQGRLSVYSP